jgi:hypothetical protein
MPQIIQKIATILNNYGYGKLCAFKRKTNSVRMGRLKDLVSISDEARKRCNSGDEEVTPWHIDEMYKK